MKDYLKEKLTQEERLLILGIIWKVARKYKVKYYNEQKKYCGIIDNIDLSIEDTYTFYFQKEKVRERHISVLPAKGADQ